VILTLEPAWTQRGAERDQRFVCGTEGRASSFDLIAPHRGAANEDE
jgi:hypothetical protein